MKALAAALAVAALLGPAAAPAAADGTRIIIGGGAFRSHRFFQPQHTRMIAVPNAVLVPTYVVPSYPRWVPGYWTYQWAPQVYTTYAWMPGYYNPDGYWVEGHYELQTIQSGFYQPLWIGGYWQDP